jgi:hypothetical protein
MRSLFHGIGKLIDREQQRRCQRKKKKKKKRIGKTGTNE